MSITLVNKKILLISPEPWGQHFVSKHHYAVILAQQGNTVYFLNPPSSAYTVHSTNYQNLFILNYRPFLKGLRYLPDAVQRKMMRQKYDKLQQLSQCIFDTVWSFDNSVFYDFSALPKSVLKISHIVDLNQDFQTAKATRTADVCFGVTDAIQQRLRHYNKRSFKIQHGYTPQRIADYKMPEVNELIKAVYIGNLSISFIDWEIIQQTVEENIEVAFLFVGPDGTSNLSQKTYHSSDKERVKKLSNTYFVGPVQYDKLSSILCKADILLVAYQSDYHLQAANSHKMLDYLSSGKVVVATYTDEYKDTRDLLVMSEKNEEYPALFAEVVANLNQYNSQEKQEVRKRFALDNTYEKQLERIESYINLSVQRSCDSYY